MLVTGMLPFDGHSKSEVFDKINNARYDEPKHVSQECRDLIKKMLTIDPNKRISAAQAHKHPWF